MPEEYDPLYDLIEQLMMSLPLGGRERGQPEDPVLRLNQLTSPFEDERRGLHEMEMGGPAVLPPEPTSLSGGFRINPDDYGAAMEEVPQGGGGSRIRGGMISGLGEGLPPEAYGDVGPLLGSLTGGPGRPAQAPPPMGAGGGTFSESNPSQMPESRPMFDMSRLTVPRNEFDYTPGVGGTMQRRDVIDPQKLQMAMAEMQNSADMGRVDMRGQELEGRMALGEAGLQQAERFQVAENALAVEAQNLQREMMESSERQSMARTEVDSMEAQVRTQLLGQRLMSTHSKQLGVALKQMMIDVEVPPEIKAELPRIMELNKTDPQRAIEEFQALVGGGGGAGAEADELLGLARQ